MNENQNDNQSGGLFSDEYEAPKRENPYLKKNRDKAKTEKAPRPEKKRGETIDSGSQYVSSVDPAPTASTPGEAELPKEREAGAPRKRSFSDWMFEHVKLIAAIATMLAVLALVMITDVVSLVEDLVTQSQQADKEELTLTYVKGLSEKSSPISWGDLDRFRRDESKAKDSVTWMIPVEGGQYEIWISGSSTSKSPAYIYLFDLESGDKMTLGEDNFDIFIQEHTKHND